MCAITRAGSPNAHFAANPGRLPVDPADVNR
jgi:hypothetical protein